MAGNRIDINLSVSDQNNTLQSRTNDAKKFNAELERSQQLLQSTGTRSGNQAMRQAAFSGQVEDYNRAQGVGGRAGGSARDFADQSRGLSGLVRIYAEFAANLFAASAAFTALRNAMDTQIMIRGMEQLSAATGTSLVSISRSFSAATDGMISFREAAEAVTKASTSGLGREQILQIAEVAKGASQALGINMNDAVSRLTRGITKLEPELLDELGIFTKLDKAVNDYARTVGKSATQLTDFERRQAFANAVLTEGRTKFSEIAQEGNPYDKLLASLKDTGIKLLTVINGVVAPIAKIFADNQVLIIGAITLIASKLISKAIPALNDYASWLKKTAEQSANVARGMSQDVWATQYTRRADKAGLADSQKLVVGLAYENLELQKQVDAVKKQQVNKIEEIIRRDNQLAVLQAKILANQRQITAERIKQNNIAESTLSSMSKEPTLLGDTWGFMKAKIAGAKNQTARGLDIVSQITEITQDAGPIAGFQKLNELLKANSSTLGIFSKAGTIAASVLSIIGQTIGTLVGYLSKFFAWIGFLIAGYELLKPLLTSNAKQVEIFNTSIDQLSDSIKTLNDVQEKYQNNLSTESILAYSNSIEDIAKSFKKVIDSFDKAKAAQNPLDKWINSINNTINPFVDSLEEKTSKQVAELVSSILKATQGPETEALRSQLQNLFGSKIALNIDEMDRALQRLDQVSYKNVTNQILQLVTATATGFSNTKRLVSNFEESSKSAAVSYDNLINSVRDQSPISVFINNMIDKTYALSESFTDAKSAAAAMNRMILEGTKGISMLGLANQDAFKLQELLKKYEELKAQDDEFTKTRQKNQEKLDSLIGKPDKNTERLALEKLMTENGRLQQVVRDNLVKIQKEVQSITQSTIGNQITLLFEQANLQLQKISIDKQKQLLNVGPKVETIERVRLEGKLERQAISVENELVKVNQRLVLSSLAQRIALDRLSLQLEKNRITEELKSRELGMARREELVDESRKIDKSLQAYASPEQLDDIVAGKLGLENIQKLISNGASSLRQVVPILQSIQQTDAQAAAKIGVSKVTQAINEIKAKGEEAARRMTEDLSQLETTYANLNLSQATKENIDLQILARKNEIERQNRENIISQLQEKAERPELSADNKRVVESEIKELEIQNTKRKELDRINETKKQSLVTALQTQQTAQNTLAIESKRLEVLEKLFSIQTEIGLESRQQLRAKAADAQIAARAADLAVQLVPIKRAIEVEKQNIEKLREAANRAKKSEDRARLNAQVTGRTKLVEEAEADVRNRESQEARLSALDRLNIEIDKENTKTEKGILLEQRKNELLQTRLQIFSSISSFVQSLGTGATGVFGNIAVQFEKDEEEIRQAKFNLEQQGRRNIKKILEENRQTTEAENLGKEIQELEKLNTDRKNLFDRNIKRREEEFRIITEFENKTRKIKPQIAELEFAESLININNLQIYDLETLKFYKQQKFELNELLIKDQLDQNVQLLGVMAEFFRETGRIDLAERIKEHAKIFEQQGLRDKNLRGMKNYVDTQKLIRDAEIQTIQRSIVALDIENNKRKEIDEQTKTRLKNQRNLLEIQEQADVQTGRLGEPEFISRKALRDRQEFVREERSTLGQISADIARKTQELRKAQKEAEIIGFDDFNNPFTVPGTSDTITTLKAELEALRRRRDYTVENTNAQIAFSQAQERSTITLREYEAQSVSMERAERSRLTTTQLITQALDSQQKLEEQRLDRALETGAITQDTAKYRKNTMNRLRIYTDYINQIQALDKEDSINRQKLREEEARETILDQDFQGNVFTRVLETPRIRELKESIRLYEQRKRAIESTRDADMAANDLLIETTQKQLDYEQAFVNSFKRMEDAIVEWAKTGEFSVKNFFKAFLEELLRAEIRAASSKMLSSLGGGKGIVDFFTKLFSGDEAAGPVVLGGPAAAKGAVFEPKKYIKGGAFDIAGYVPGYAKGGMFTNSVVNKPTLFAFAKGGNIGLMGEAGPEAIMPLKRDSQGNLGVRTNQANVEVVVNNYTNEKATAMETTDGRGNRRVEVQIGDIVAGQMTTPNSNLQQAMTNNFNARPRIVRR